MSVPIAAGTQTLKQSVKNDSPFANVGLRIQNIRNARIYTVGTIWHGQLVMLTPVLQTNQQQPSPTPPLRPPQLPARLPIDMPYLVYTQIYMYVYIFIFTIKRNIYFYIIFTQVFTFIFTVIFTFIFTTTLQKIIIFYKVAT